MTFTTGNKTDLIRQQVYSDFILRALPDFLPPEAMFRDVGDFMDGDTLNIPSIGTRTIQDVTENEAITYNDIDTGRQTFTITDYVGDGWAITDKMRQDGYNVDALLAANAEESARAMAENFATRMFEVLEGAQTASDPNTINGRAHRFVGGNSNKIQLNDFFKMKLAFDKANVPSVNRLAIVDPSTAYTLNDLFQNNHNVDSNPVMQGIIEEGISSGMNYVMNLGGFTILESNLLPEIASGTDVDGTTSLSNAGVANLFMSVASDQTKPGMKAWRQSPKTETARNKDYQRDEWVTTARYGLGSQRQDTLGVIVTETNV